MSPNILITGAAGYIGGSVLADFISRPTIDTADIIAAVRSKDQVKEISGLGAKAIQLDLNNEAEVKRAVLEHEISIVVHLATSMSSSIASYLIDALGDRGKTGGRKTYYIHASVTSMFSKEGGWPFGEVRDTDAIYEKEKQIEAGNPVRDTNILVVERSKKQGVTSLIVGIPFVYGEGSGTGRKISVSIPALIRTSIKLKSVYKFDTNSSPPAAHVSDVVALYALLVEKILSGKEKIPSGEAGYYFAIAHRHAWWDVMARLAQSLHRRGLVEEPIAKTWPSYEMAAESLGWPLQYIVPMGMSNGDMVPVNAPRLGWQPKWNEERFLENIDAEVQSVLDFDTVPASVYDSLLADGK